MMKRAIMFESKKALRNEITKAKSLTYKLLDCALTQGR